MGASEPADSSARNFSYDLESTPFNTVMDVDVIRALPLAVGFEATLGSSNPPRPPPPAPARVRVRGMEMLRRDMEAWRASL